MSSGAFGGMLGSEWAADVEPHEVFMMALQGQAR